MLYFQMRSQIFKRTTLGCDNSALKIPLVYTTTMLNTNQCHILAEAAAGAGWMCS